MSTYVGEANGVKTDQEGHHKTQSQTLTAGVPLNFNANSLKVVQRGAGANMSVDVSVGSALLLTPDLLQAYEGWTDAATNAPITTANPTNGRVDVVCAYVDPTSFAATSNNSPGSFKFYVATGTPSGSPISLTDAAIQTLLGTNIAFVKLAFVFVAAAAATVTTGVITDARVGITTTVNSGANTVTPNALQSGTGTSWVWGTWTPTWTNVSGGTTNYAKFSQAGKRVDFRIKYTLGGAGVSGPITFSTPVAMAADYASTDIVDATTVFYDLSATTPYQGTAFTATTSTLVLRSLHTDGTKGNNEVTSSSDPFGFAAGDIIYCSGKFEAA